MSLYKIDGHVLSVNEIVTWIGGFVTLHRKGALKEKEMPPEVAKIMGQADEKKIVKDMLAYLRKDEDYLNALIDVTKRGMADMAVEKMRADE